MLEPLSMIGTVISKYTISAKVKDGSTGSVWQARNGEKVVALKIIHQRFAQDSRKKKLFKREATVQSKLNHPGIVGVHEYIEGKRPTIVMDFFQSDEIKVAIQEHPEWIKGHRMKILKEAASALLYCHQQGVVHRDIKPQNILVCDKGDARLIDFSLAQTKWDRLLQFGKKVHGGTPSYMAPEQIRGNKIDGRADMYALGCVAYELFTGKEAFKGKSQTELFDAHLKGTIPSVRSVVDTFPIDLDRIFQKMLAKSPDERYPDMGTVVSEFRKWESKLGSRG